VPPSGQVRHRLWRSCRRGNRGVSRTGRHPGRGRGGCIPRVVRPVKPSAYWPTMLVLGGNTGGLLKAAGKQEQQGRLASVGAETLKAVRERAAPPGCQLKPALELHRFQHALRSRGLARGRRRRCRRGPPTLRAASSASACVSRSPASQSATEPLQSLPSSRAAWTRAAAPRTRR